MTIHPTTGFVVFDQTVPTGLSASLPHGTARLTLGAGDHPLTQIARA